METYKIIKKDPRLKCSFTLGASQGFPVSPNAVRWAALPSACDTMGWCWQEERIWRTAGKKRSRDVAAFASTTKEQSFICLVVFLGCCCAGQRCWCTFESAKGDLFGEKSKSLLAFSGQWCAFKSAFEGVKEKTNDDSEDTNDIYFFNVVVRLVPFVFSLTSWTNSLSNVLLNRTSWVLF